MMPSGITIRVYKVLNDAIIFIVYRVLNDGIRHHLQCVQGVINDAIFMYHQWQVPMIVNR